MTCITEKLNHVAAVSVEYFDYSLLFGQSQKYERNLIVIIYGLKPAILTKMHFDQQ